MAKGVMDADLSLSLSGTSFNFSHQYICSYSDHLVKMVSLVHQFLKIYHCTDKTTIID